MFAKIIGWGLAALFGLSGLALMVTAPVAGLCFLLIAALFAPPATEALKEKINITVSGKAKLLVTLALLFGATLAINEQTDKDLAKYRAEQALEEKAKQEKVKAEKLAKFTNEKNSILESIKELLEKGEHSKALSISREYNFTNDAELTALTDQVKIAQLEVTKIRETEEMLTKLKTIPASDIRENHRLYKKLASYHPDNTSYKSKLEKYHSLVTNDDEKKRLQKEKEQKERLAYVTSYGEQPEQSKWDGSYRAVEKYLKAAANDPSSIDIDGCTQVYKNKTGWLVGCDYRGKNAFGALVKNSNWFTIAHGQVINVESSDTYKR